MKTHFSKKKALSSMMFAAGAAALAGEAQAFHFYPYIETMGNDVDQFEVYNTNPKDAAAALPAGNGAGQRGITVYDYRDFRGSTPGAAGAFAGPRSGILEEVHNGYVNGVLTPDGSGHYGIMQTTNGTYGYGYGNGPSGYIGYGAGGDPDPGYGAGVTPIPSASLSSRWDLYVDPALAANNSGSISWDQGISTLFGYTGYTEARMIMTPKTNGTWDFRTSETAALIANVPVGQWVTMEIVPFDIGGNIVGFKEILWNIDHTVQLGEVDVTNYLGASAPYSSFGAPAYDWFTISGAFYDSGTGVGNGSNAYLLLDNGGWDTPITLNDRVLAAPEGDPFLAAPEPASMSLLAIGGALMLRRRKTQRA